MFWQVLLAVAVVVLWWKISRKQPIMLHGKVHPSFENVSGKFSAMVQQDSEGAALAVLHRGKVVVHLFGGYANREKNQPWTEDTMAIAYCTTKIWAALTSAILAGRGLLHYDENVTTFWPEFGKNGKGNITIRDVLDHRAGLITFGREFGLEEAKDSNAIAELIELATPLWTPGSHRGYHALTYGFLVDQIIRRLHPKGYDIPKIYKEEIREEGTDFFIGSEGLSQHRIAHVSNPSILQAIIAQGKMPIKERASKKVKTNTSLHATVSLYPEVEAGLYAESNVAEVDRSYVDKYKDPIPYNDPAVRELSLTSCMGIGTALGFAQAIQQVFKKNMIPDSIRKIISEPTATEEDMVLAEEKSFGHGFIYARHPVRKEDWIIRIIGHGLQVVELDLKEEVITVMLRNGLRPWIDGLEEFEDISKTIFQVVGSQH